LTDGLIGLTEDLTEGFESPRFLLEPFASNSFPNTPFF
jgi:hypothetical protein